MIPASAGADLAARAAALAARLAALPRPARLKLNRNRSVFISLRADPRGALVLSVRPEILDHAAAVHDLPQWVASRGRGSTPAMRAALDAVGADLRESERMASPAPHLAPLDGPLDLPVAFARVHAAWFPHLPRPELGWSRRVSKPRRRHVRFACYRRHPVPLVLVSRRLDQPWVARAFVDYVLYHELCHHAQACDPRRGETPHSARFRAWERRFPDWQLIERWERAHLDAFLTG